MHFSNKDLKTLHLQLKIIDTHYPLWITVQKPRKELALRIHLNIYKLLNFMVIMKYRTIMFNDSLFISLLQYLKNLFKSVSIWKSIWNFAVTSTKDSQQIPENQIIITESLISKNLFQVKIWECIQKTELPVFTKKWRPYWWPLGRKVINAVINIQSVKWKFAWITKKLTSTGSFNI